VSCRIGHGMMVGKNACAELQANGTVVVPECAGLCVVATASSLVFGACTDAGATGWSVERPSLTVGLQ
jgi:hypothetical protein